MQMAIVQYVLAVYRKVSLCIGFRLITSLRVDCQWADAKCRVAKRQTRQRERAYTSVCRRLNRALLHNSTSSESTDAATARVAAAKSAWYEQRRAYRLLRQRKCTAFWVDKVESERSHPSKLWESVDKLLGRGRTSACPSLSVETLNSFFVEKVCKVRATHCYYWQRVCTDVLTSA